MNSLLLLGGRVFVAQQRHVRRDPVAKWLGDVAGATVEEWMSVALHPQEGDVLMRIRLTLVVVVAVLALGVGTTTSRAASSCQFVLGFKTLHDLIPGVVGDCVTDEQHNPTNGDGLQQTTNGLLVWRKADNFTAFTDGYRTWVNGPFGLQERLNAQRFDWEKRATVPSTRVVSYVAPTTASATASGNCFASSLAATRADALRCAAGNEILDPCFTTPASAQAVICVRNPLDPGSIVRLNLSGPIAVPQYVLTEKRPWFLELADGTVCNFFTGATAGIGGERINYGCSDGWVIVGQPTTGAVWTVHEVRLAPASLNVLASAQVQVMIAWE
jgi:hypothetical protein